jgi:hypothetical protein
MTHAPVHPPSPDRRAATDRRAGADRRADGEPALTLLPVERRSGKERRRSDRRTKPDPRINETVREHIGNALQLLSTVSQSTTLDDRQQRDLDSAIFRLRFALDRLERDKT